MTPMRFHRVTILVTQENGWLNKTMPQEDFSYIYEIYGDSGKTYYLKKEEFDYTIDEVENEPKR